MVPWERFGCIFALVVNSTLRTLIWMWFKKISVGNDGRDRFLGVSGFGIFLSSQSNELEIAGFSLCDLSLLDKFEILDYFRFSTNGM